MCCWAPRCRSGERLGCAGSHLTRPASPRWCNGVSVLVRQRHGRPATKQRRAKERPMSTRPSPEPGRSPVTIPGLLEQKRSGRPIVMVTAYDYPSARAAESAGVDVVLVGDSGAMTVLGHPSTVSVTVDEMLMLTKAARRGVDTALFVAALPSGCYAAGADGVKLERGGPNSVSRARAVVGAGIPVMGHVGLTPQTATSLGGYRAQGRSAESALSIARGALDLQAAGCFSLVFEAVPSVLTQDLMQLIRIPVIGIGAGPATDGQVLAVSYTHLTLPTKR